MSATIDERIVKMEFDNKDFEKNVATSLSTLDKLKNALTFTKQKEEVQTLSELVNTTKFDGMANSIEAIQDKFSAFGVFGKRIIENLADEFYNFTKNVITAIPNQIAQGGWARAMNVEDAKFTLKGLGVAWEEVADDIDHAVLGTAYGADEAAKVASQLAASGVQAGGIIGELEDGTKVYSEMGRSLRAVSGVAAMTHSSFSEIGHIFTTIAGQGKITAEQLNQFAVRGLNVAGALADVWGVTEAEVRDMVHEGEVDFQLFADAMDVAFGEHATQANETFQGSMDNMKAALSRIGQDWAQVILQQTPQLFNSIKELFNKIRKYTKPIADHIFNPAFTKAMQMLTGIVEDLTAKMPDTIEWITNLTERGMTKGNILNGIYNLFEGILNIGPAVLSVIKPIVEAFMEVFENPFTSDGFFKMTQNFDNFTAGLKLTDEQSKNLKDTFTDLFEVFKQVGGVIGNLVHDLSPFAKVFGAVARLVIRITKAFGNLFRKLKGGSEIDDTTDSVDHLYEGIDKLADILVGVIDTVANFMEGLISDDLFNFIEGIKSAIDWVKEFDKETGILTGTVQFLGTVIAAPFYIIYKLASAIKDFAVEVYNMPETQRIIATVTDQLSKFGDDAYEKFKKVTDYIRNTDPKKFFSDLKGWIDDAKISVSDFFDRLAEKSSIFSTIKDEISKAIDNFKLLTGGVSAHTLYDEFEEPIENADTVTSNWKDTLDKVIEKLKDFFSTIDTNQLIVLTFTVTMAGMLIAVWRLVDSFTKLSKGAVGVVTSVRGVFDTISETVASFKKKDTPLFVQIAEAIAIVAASLAVLALMDAKYHGNLINATKLLGAIGAGLLLFSLILSIVAKRINKADSWKELATLDATMLSLSASVLILAAAIKVLEDIHIYEAEKNILIILQLAGIIAAMTVIITKFAGKGFKGFFAMLGMALILNRFAKAMVTLSKARFDNAQKNVEALIVIFAGMSLLALASSKMGVFSSLGLIAMIFALDKIIPMIVELFGDSAIVNKLDAILGVIDRNIKVVLALSGILSAMTIISSLFGKGVKKFGIGMILLAGSLIVLYKAIDLLGNMDSSVLAEGIRAITLILGAFAVLSLVLGITNGGSKAIKIAAAIGLMTLALYPLSGAIWILGTMDAKKVEQGTKAVAALMLCFAVVTAAAGFAQKGKVSFGSILAMTTAIVLLTAEMIVLTFIPVEKIKASVIAMTTVMGVAGLLMVAISKVGNQEHPLLAVAQLIAVTGMIFVLAMSISKLAQFNWKDSLGAAGGLALVVLSITSLFTFVKPYKILTVEQSVQALLEVFLLMIPLFLAISLTAMASAAVGWQNIIAAAVALSLTITAVMLSLTNYTPENILSVTQSLNLMAQLFTTMIPLFIAISLLSMVSAAIGWTNVVAAAVALDIAFVGIMFALNKFTPDSILSATQSLSLMVELFTILVPLFLAITALSLVTAAIGWDNVIASAIALDIVFTGIMFALNKFPVESVTNAIDSLKLFVELFMILIPVVASLWFLSNYGGSWEKMIAASIAIVTVVDGLGLICAVLSKFEISIAGAAKAAVALGGFIDILITLVGAYAWLISNLSKEQFDKIMAGLDRMIQVAKKTGDLIGAFVGGIFGEAFKVMMEDFGKGLEAFSIHTKPFTDYVATIDDNVAKGTWSLAKAIMYLSASKVIDGLAMLLNPFGNFSIESSFRLLGKGVKAFSEAVVGVDPVQVENAARAAEAILGIKPQNEGGILALITGDNALWQFNPLTLGPAGFGGGLKAFANAASGINFSDVQGAVAVAEALFNLDPPNTGGIISLFTGENFVGFFNPVTLGATGFGGGLRAFANSVTSIEMDKVRDGLELAKAIFDFDPPNTGGLISLFTGENSLAMFNWLTLGPTGLGGGIALFAKCIEGIKMEKVLPGLTVAKEILNLKPGNSGGLITWFVGDNSLWSFDWLTLGPTGLGGGIALFAKCIEGIRWEDVAGGVALTKAISQIKPQAKGGLLASLIGGSLFGLGPMQLGKIGIGGGIEEFAKCVSNIDNDTLTKANVAASVLDVLNNIKIARSGGLFGFIDYLATGGFEKNYKKMADYFATLGLAVGSFAENATKVDGVKASIAVANLQFIMSLLQNAQSFDVTKITGFTDAMNKAGTLGIDKFCEAFYNAKEKIDKAVESFANTVNSSISTNQSTLNSTMENYAQEAINSINGNGGFGFDTSGYSEKVGDIGLNFDNSLIKGLTDPSSLQETFDAGEGLSMETLKGLMSDKGLDMASFDSPSEAAKALGIKVPEGFGMGVSDSNAVNTVIGNAEGVTQKIASVFDTSNSSSILSWDKLLEKGRNVIRGFAAGLGDTNLIDQAAGNVGSLASRVNAEWDNYWRIHSPSKLAEEKGKYVVEGYALGFSNNYGTLENAASGLGKEAYDAFTSSTNNISDYVAENLDITPAITPYLDLTGVQNDANNINSLFEDSQGLTINSHLGAMTDMFGEMNANSLLSNSQIVTSLQSLHEDVQNLQNVVGNLQVIMDSGSLVGAIAPNMDVALGQMAMYKRRGM